MMDVHEFHRALGDAIDQLDKVKAIDEQAKAAERRLASANADLAIAADAHAKIKQESDEHLAANRHQRTAEIHQHQTALEDLKKKYAQLAELHRAQEEGASETLTALNMDVARKLKAKDELSIQIEQMRGTIHELASKL